MILMVIFSCLLVICNGDTRPYFKVRQLSTVTNPVITEVSGMAASRSHPTILYVQNDSGDGPFVYAINATTGEVVSTINVNNAINNDWEDLAYGICPGERYCIYIGDFGGNTVNGSRNTIYRVKEPQFLIKAQTVEIDATLKFSWTEHDCEIIMVDPTGEIYLVSKNTGIPGKVVMVPNSAWNSEDRINLTDLVSLSFYTEYPDPTGGDISPNGTEVLIISVDHLYYWSVPDQMYLTALTKAPVYLNYKDEPQGEAVCWDSSGSGFFTLSEGTNQPIYYYERLPRPTGEANHNGLNMISFVMLLLVSCWT